MFTSPLEKQHVLQTTTVMPFLYPFAETSPQTVPKPHPKQLLDEGDLEHISAPSLFRSSKTRWVYFVKLTKEVTVRAALQLVLKDPQQWSSSLLR